LKTCPAPWRRANHQEGWDRNNAGQYIGAGYDVCTKAMHKSQLPNMRRWGAEQAEVKCLNSFVSEPTLYPTQNIVIDSDNITVVTDNLSNQRQQMCASSVHPKKPVIPTTHAVADTGATSVLVMKNTPMKNIRPTTNPLNINLTDGRIVKSTHICDLEIPGLPHVLEGHIVPELTVVSLVGIRIFCKLGALYYLQIQRVM
jgi:hypothetical protein